MRKLTLNQLLNKNPSKDYSISLDKIEETLVKEIKEKQKNIEIKDSYIKEIQEQFPDSIYIKIEKELINIIEYLIQKGNQNNCIYYDIIYLLYNDSLIDWIEIGEEIQYEIH